MIASGDELAVCAVTVGEFYSGLQPLQHAQSDAFFSTLRYWDISRSAARQAGIWRREFRERGITL